MHARRDRLPLYSDKLAHNLRKNTIMIYQCKSNICLKIMAMQILLLLVTVVVAQVPQDPVMLRFGPDFRFRDGIYANYDMVKANCPIPPSRVATDLDYGDPKFFKELMAQENMVLYDDQGVGAVLKPGDIWGYSFKGIMYIQIGERFHRLLPEGMLSRFIASGAIWEELSPGSGEQEGYLPYSTSSKRYNPVYFELARRKEVLLLDFEDNLMTTYSPEAMLEKLEKDSLLYREYESLGNNKRKKKMLEYLKRYNQRHPIMEY